MFVDFFFIRKQKWANNKGWNWIATIAILAGSLVGYLTEYVIQFGIPALQSLIISGVVYLLVMKVKARLKPDHFTNTEYAKKGLVG